MKKIILVSFIGFLVVMQAYGSNGPSEGALKEFSKTLDKLLIDTAHVYVNPSQPVQCFYSEETGAVCTGRISMTAFGGSSIEKILGKTIRLKVGDEDILSIETSEDRDEEIVKEVAVDSGDVESQMLVLIASLSSLSELSKLAELSKLSELSKHPELAGLAELSKLSELSKLAELATLKDIKIPEVRKQIRKVRTVMDGESKDRLEEMDKHLTEFKSELAKLISESGKIWKSLPEKSMVSIVLFVSESEFAEKFGSDKIMVKFPAGKLDKKEKDALKQIEFNL